MSDDHQLHRVIVHVGEALPDMLPSVREQLWDDLEHIAAYSPRGHLAVFTRARELLADGVYFGDLPRMLRRWANVD